MLQMNIWHSGTSVPDGYQTVVDEIAHRSPDIVLLCEVANGKDQSFADCMIASLGERGLKYYSFRSHDSGLWSKYPIIESTQIFPDAEHPQARGTIFRALVRVDGQEMAIYTAHLDYLNYACYLPRGYSGSSWKPLACSVTDLKTVLDDNLKSWRDEAIACFLKAAAEDQKRGRPVFLGGDFNEPSHLDWTQETAQLWDHNGLVVPWHASVALSEAGYKDSFRLMYPDPVQYPGFTFPADCPLVPVEKLAWAPKADERERIDFIYFHPGQLDLHLKRSQVLGPVGCILRGKRSQTNQGKDEILAPHRPAKWPSDHRALFAEWSWKEQAK